MFHNFSLNFQLKYLIQLFIDGCSMENGPSFAFMAQKIHQLNGMHRIGGLEFD